MAAVLTGTVPPPSSTLNKEKRLLLLKKMILLGFCFCLALCLCACSEAEATEPEFVLTYAENQAQNYPTSLGGERFAELVKERTEGKVIIQVKYAGEYGTDEEVVSQMQFGGIDFARISLAVIADEIPMLNVLQMPFLYQDAAHMWRILDGEIGTELLQTFQDAKLIGLSWYDSGASDRGTLCINVTPQKPILMVMAENGEQYYLDKEGATMPLDKFNLQLCVATGNITPQFAKQHLLPLAHYIYGSPFWSEQIEQIHVFSQDNITLYPRVGNHTIVLGDSRNFEDKLNRMLLFYEKGLPQVGWNRYESINLAYKGQIVCKKRNNKNK